MKPPAFQFYADDFVAGVADMTQSEVGAYILLLCRQWCAGEIPSDASRLNLIAKGDVTAHVAAKFINGKNKRMEMVRAENDAWREKCRIGGIHSAASRKGSSTTLGTTLASKVQLSGQVNGNTPSPSPSPTTKTTKLPAKLKKWPIHKAELVGRIESCLGVQWENDRSKWLRNIDSDHDKSARVIAEVESAIKESRIKTTPAQYAEQIWKEFKCHQPPNNSQPSAESPAADYRQK